MKFCSLETKTARSGCVRIFLRLRFFFFFRRAKGAKASETTAKTTTTSTRATIASLAWLQASSSSSSYFVSPHTKSGEEKKNLFHLVFGDSISRFLRILSLLLPSSFWACQMSDCQICQIFGTYRRRTTARARHHHKKT